MTAKKAFRFVARKGGAFPTFKLVVFASSLAAARRYVRNQSSSAAHRNLVFAGEGEPSPTDGWTAATAE